MERTFETCRPADLAAGDVVKGNGALWKVLGFTPLRAAERWKTTGRVIDEMVEVECIDACGQDRPFHVGYRKQFVRQPHDGTWERLVHP